MPVPDDDRVAWPPAPKPRRGLPGERPADAETRQRYARVGGCFVGLLAALLVAAYVVNQTRLAATQGIAEARLADLERERDDLAQRLAAAEAERLLPADTAADAYAVAVIASADALWLTARRPTQVWLRWQPADGRPASAAARTLRLAAGETVGLLPAGAGVVVAVRPRPGGGVDMLPVVAASAAAAAAAVRDVAAHPPPAGTEPTLVLAGLARPTQMALPWPAPDGERLAVVLGRPQDGGMWPLADVAAADAEAEADGETGRLPAKPPLLWPLGGE